jgi:hypothetical protein
MTKKEAGNTRLADFVQEHNLTEIADELKLAWAGLREDISEGRMTIQG